MTLTEYINKLQRMADEGYGELKVIYAKDDEGNGFYPVVHDPTLGEFDEEEEDFWDDGLDPTAICIN